MSTQTTMATIHIPSAMYELAGYREDGQPIYRDKHGALYIAVTDDREPTLYTRYTPGEYTGKILNFNQLFAQIGL